MADQLATANPRVKTHGILVLHGAGTPPNQTTLVGESLVTIANGLIDHLSGPSLFGRYRVAVHASVQKEKRYAQSLTIDIFQRATRDHPEQHLHQLHLREALWKPTMYTRGIADYLPLLWLWAYTFQSQTSRKLKRISFGPHQQETEQESMRRRQSEFKLRLALAELGLIATLLIGIVVNFVVGLSFVQLSADWKSFIPTTGVPGVTSISVAAALLLTLLAVRERNSRNAGKPLSFLHINAIIATTSWLGVFLVPFLLIVYYLDKIIGAAIVVGFTALIFFVPSIVGVGWASILALVAFAVSVWVISGKSYQEKFAQPATNRLRKDMDDELANWITTLLVVAGAGATLVFILIVEALQALPFVGNDIRKFAQDISVNEMWEVIKDIHMYLTDSSRAATARAIVEQGLVDLNDDGADALYVFSHSLGTVVAYDTLVHLGRNAGSLIKTNHAAYSKIKMLTTYGSPLNKVRMLAEQAEKDPNLAESGQPMAGFDYARFRPDAVLPDDLPEFRWLNFFAPQDIVSDVLTKYHKHVDPDTRDQDRTIPHDYPAPSATDIFSAHGAYWSDREFWTEILKEMQIAL
ncbi:MAG: hypothetical protein HY327_07600 [Chloroflexi bacterium]|nr:hypothetical protein [Chloroflexota bacterium]